MAKETTTTFEVTVTHSGVQQAFWDMFNRCGRNKSTMKVNTKIIKSDTKKVPAKSKYSEEQRMVRALLKEACEKAGLKFSAKSYDVQNGEYHLKYGDKYEMKHGRSTYWIILKHKALQFKFEDGMASAGKIYLRERYRSWRNEDIALSFNLANPRLVEMLAQICQAYGKGMHPLTKLSNGDLAKVLEDKGSLLQH